MLDLTLNELSMLGTTLDKLKLVAKGRGIKNYKSTSEERLLSALGKQNIKKD